MECRVARVAPVAGAWSDTCCVAVRQLLVHKTVSVQLIESVDRSHVHVVDVMLPMGESGSLKSKCDLWQTGVQVSAVSSREAVEQLPPGARLRRRGNGERNTHRARNR